MNQNFEKPQSQILLFKLSPDYISGLTQADGSFFCSIKIAPKHLFGIQFQPKFTITADFDSKFILESIQSYFNCGNITINTKKHTAEFGVVRLTELYNIIIPHFNNYPIFCAKYHAFKLFSKIVTALFNKEKRNIQERRELLKLALSMNITTNRKIETIDKLFTILGVDEEASEFLAQRNKDIIEKILLLNSEKIIVSNNFISGFIDGDGSFFISFQINGEIKTGFNITNDLFSKPLLEIVKQKIGNIGSIREGTKKELVYTVTGLNQIVDFLIPFIDKHPVFSEKSNHYVKFRTISIMLKRENPLNLESKLNAIDLAYNMNKKGKHRNLNKSQYIEIVRLRYSNNI